MKQTWDFRRDTWDVLGKRKGWLTLNLYSKDSLKVVGSGCGGRDMNSCSSPHSLHVWVQQVRREQDYNEESPTEVFMNLNKSLSWSYKRQGEGEDEVGAGILLTSIHLPESQWDSCQAEAHDRNGTWKEAQKSFHNPPLLDGGPQTLQFVSEKLPSKNSSFLPCRTRPSPHPPPCSPKRHRDSFLP